MAPCLYREYDRGSGGVGEGKIFKAGGVTKGMQCNIRCAVVQSCTGNAVGRRIHETGISKRTVNDSRWQE
jgi:hypothetical protein